MIKLIIYGVIAAAVMGMVYAAWRTVDHWCNAACVEQKELVVEALARIAALDGVIKAAQDRATALALLWSEAVNKVEIRYVERVEVRTAQFAGLRQRAAAISQEPDSCTLRLSAQRQRLLADASRNANRSEDPAPAGPDQGAAPTVPEPTWVGEVAGLVDQAEVTSKWLDAAEAYASAREKWAACVIAYETVEKTQ